MQHHTISAGSLSATLSSHGAEPTSLRHATAGEMLWQAGPAWPKHAPVLFPIVGELKGGALRHGGRTYAMGRHGFARDREFAFVETADDTCVLRLVDDETTREQYPFAFSFEIRYAIDRDAFVATYVVQNPGPDVLPFSIGAHPAFRWPLADGIGKSLHTLTFERDEPEPIRRLSANLLDPKPQPTPVVGHTLALDDSLFASDAIVMDRVRSVAVTFSGPQTPTLRVAWSAFEQLGIWSKPGADFLCIEPWRGYASPADFDGEFVDKPGLVLLEPGASATFALRVTVAPA